SFATMDWPDNGGTMPSKSTPFTPSSILFRPRKRRTEVGDQRPEIRSRINAIHRPSSALRHPSSVLRDWWSRRVLPPGPKGLLRRPFIAIAGLHRHKEYKRKRLTKKEGMKRIGNSEIANR